MVNLAQNASIEHSHKVFRAGNMAWWEKVLATKP